MTRVIAVTFCVTLAASLAARMGSIPMAAFQVCLQVWLMSSLLADGLAVAGQVSQIPESSSLSQMTSTLTKHVLYVFVGDFSMRICCTRA